MKAAKRKKKKAEGVSKRDENSGQGEN